MNETNTKSQTYTANCFLLLPNMVLPHSVHAPVLQGWKVQVLLCTTVCTLRS